MESKNKYHTVGTVPKPNMKIVEHRLNRYPYDTYTWPSLSWLDTDKSIESGVVTSFMGPNNLK